MGRPRAPKAAPPRLPRELSRALRRLRWSRRPALWSAAPGSLRRDQLSSALRSLQRRFRVVRIAYGAIPAAEICADALAELDLPLAGDPQEALLQVLTAKTGRRARLVLVIEEADRMSLGEAVRLRDLAARSGGALRLLLVTSGGPESQRLGAVLTGAPAARQGSPFPMLSTGGASSPPPSTASLRDNPRPPAARTAEPARPIHPPPSPPLLHPSSHPAAQEALTALEECLRQGHRAVSLEGPPGMGKTLLLRWLAEHVSDAFEPIWVPCMALAGEELVRWILYCRQGRDPAGNCAASWCRALAAPGTSRRGLLLLLDDAGALTPDAASELARAIHASGGRLRVAMTRCDGATPPGGGALPDVKRVRLETPLCDVHAAALLRARFGSALNEDTIRRIVEEACGVPAALVRGASVRLARRYGLP